MKIDFGIIAFNCLETLPKNMLKSCIDNIYDFANKIHISEGACKPTEINNGNATSFSKNGHSTDGTLEFLYNYPDPENKIKIYTKDGYWSGKIEMVQSWDIEGDYIWCVDTDEFYKKQDMQKIINYLKAMPNTERVDFYSNQFFGDFDNYCDENQKGWSQTIPWMRIYKYDKGDRWNSATPYLLSDANGRMKDKNVLNRDMTRMMGIYLYHYAYVCKSQAEFKKIYYNNPKVYDLWVKWQKDHNISLINGDRTKKFTDQHPEIIKELIESNKNT